MIIVISRNFTNFHKFKNYFQKRTKNRCPKLKNEKNFWKKNLHTFPKKKKNYNIIKI